MSPKIWTIPILNLPIYSYGFMIMMGFLVGIFLANRRAKKNGIDPEIIFDVGIIVMIAGIVGARIAYIIIFYDQFGSSWQVFNVFDTNLNFIGIVIGFLSPYGFMMWKKKKLTIKAFAWLVPICLVSALLLGRILYIAFNFSEYDISIFEIWKGGLVFYGGLILAIPAGIFYLKKKNIEIWKLGDIVAPSVALGLVFGRIGCLLNGCCWGTIAKSYPLSICFPNLNKTSEMLVHNSPVFQDHLNQGLIARDALCSLPVHPTQIYEAVFALCLFIFLSLLANKKTGKGLVLWTMVLLYSLGRFIIEFWRGDKTAVFIGLTDSQTISVGLFIIAAVFLLHLTFKKPKDELIETAKEEAN